MTSVISFAQDDFAQADPRNYADGQFIWTREIQGYCREGYYMARLGKWEYRNRWPILTTSLYSITTDKTAISGDGVDAATVTFTFPAMLTDTEASITVNDVVSAARIGAFDTQNMTGWAQVQIVSATPGSVATVTNGDASLSIEVI